MIMTCTVCGSGSRRLRKTRCDTCYRHLLKHATDRTPAQVDRALENRWEAFVRRQELAVLIQRAGAGA